MVLLLGSEGTRTTWTRASSPSHSIEGAIAKRATTKSRNQAILDTAPTDMLRMRQLSKVVRLDRDKGMKGDGFEWAVHEAILGGENKVLSPIHEAMTRASTFVVRDSSPTPDVHPVRP